MQSIYIKQIIRIAPWVVGFYTLPTGGGVGVVFLIVEWEAY